MLVNIKVRDENLDNLVDTLDFISDQIRNGFLKGYETHQNREYFFEVFNTMSHNLPLDFEQ